MLAEIPNSKNLDPLLVEAIKNMPEKSIIAWQLCMRNPQEKWSSAHGRVIQVGDSAHSFIPTSGSGATMALEDSVSLAECLRLGRDNIKIAVQVHVLLR